MLPRRDFYIYYPFINKISKYVKIKYYYDVQRYQIFKKTNIDLSLKLALGRKIQYNNINIIAS